MALRGEDGQQRMMTRDLHVVFGAGQVGRPLARMRLETGRRVRIAKRSVAGLPSGAEVATGDAADPEFCVEAASGAATIYHCMNPPYDARVWADLVPRFMNNLIEAAGRAGARLVVLDNVYMLGRPGGKPLSEDSPLDPCSRKGEIRARAAEQLFAAHRRGDVVATSGRASDFYGPGGALTHLGDHFWPAALAGRTARAVVDPDAVHTYHYIPDVARGLATLGTAGDEAYGRPWMLPCAPAESIRDLVSRMADKLGRDIKVSAVPGWIVRALGPFVALARELDEMRYQWEEPFIIDDRRFRTSFGIEPADVHEAAAATVAWATEHYGPGTRGAG
jgi:nucleoside-diphosphate-sugar epimerase